jgi:hypothetical protein
MRARVSVGATVLVLALLALSQVELPRLASDRVRGELARSGEVEAVSVHALPALTLLWGHADRVEVRMRSYRTSPDRLGAALAGTDRAHDLDASAGTVATGLLTLRDARLRKRGSALSGEALVTRADLRAALPPGVTVQPVIEPGGQLVLDGTASAFGASVRVRARLLVQDGRVVVEPEGALLGSLLRITVFSDPRIRVDGIGARAAGDGFVVSVRGRRTG